jgi:hypothetical protein
MTSLELPKYAVREYWLTEKGFEQDHNVTFSNSLERICGIVLGDMNSI